MVFESIRHFLSKEPHKINQVQNEQPVALQDISLSPSAEPDNKRARTNRLAQLSTQEKAA